MLHRQSTPVKNSIFTTQLRNLQIWGFRKQLLYDLMFGLLNIVNYFLRNLCLHYLLYLLESLPCDQM